MRYFIVKIVVLSMISLLLFPRVGHAIPDTSAKQALLMERETGRILYGKQPDEEVLIASVTKIMTAIIALEYGDLSDKVSVSKRAIYTEGSSIYLNHDKEMTLEDLLYGLMLRSGNDAAVAIAEHIGGSVEGFVYLMNEKARFLGMTHSSFMNPHGLDDANHYSSAYDMAILMRYAMEHLEFQKISNSKSYLSENRTYKWYNKNKLLTKLYEYCTGGKTGFTKKAGRTLVTTASKDGIDLIAVTLNASSDWNDHIAMYEWGFTTFRKLQLEEKGPFNFLNESGELIHGLLLEDVVYPLNEEDKKSLEKRVVKSIEPSSNKIAQLEYRLNAELIAVIPVYEANTKGKGLFFDKFIRVLKGIAQVSADG